ncbi:MAG: phosphoribosylanthranilate isomerase [Ilumatobacteraceae bacterium]
MFVKICGITSEDDALLAVAMGADAVGFIFAPSPRQVAAQRVNDIVRRLPPEVLTVGVFKDELPTRVLDIADRAGVRAVQLHGSETPDQVAEIMAGGVGHGIRHVIKAFGADSPNLARADRYHTDLVLVDAPSPGSGKVFDWHVTADVPDSVRMILAGGLNPDNVADAIAAVEPWGVDVSSGVEEAPGRKDAAKVRRFIANARAASPTPYLGPDELPYDWEDE